MDDCVDDNFKPLQLAYTIDEVFPLGRVLIAAEAASRLEPAFVQECLARHASGDWGEVDRTLKWGNARTLRSDHTMPIVSKFPVGGGRLQITTRADGSVTSLILYAAEHSPSSPDAEPLTRFAEYEIEPRIGHWEDGDPEKPDHIACDEHEADLWRLYGNIPGRDSVCIGEYATRALAEEVYAGITGRRYRSRS
jgi:hypothetical protein